MQYNAALTITGAIKGQSCKKLYQELGLEYLQQRRWMRPLMLPVMRPIKTVVLKMRATLAPERCRKFFSESDQRPDLAIQDLYDLQNKL